MENAFGMNVDFGMVIKNYGADKGEHHQERRYSAPEVTSMQKIDMMGRPERDLLSTSHIERLNGTTRLHMRRLTRLTYAFSKKMKTLKLPLPFTSRITISSKGMARSGALRQWPQKSRKVFGRSVI
jgi:hypothetical protein